MIFEHPIYAAQAGGIAIEGMPSADQPWFAFHLWTVHTLWEWVAISTALALVESSIRQVRLDPHAFFRPWALAFKMFIIVFVSNFGWEPRSIVPLVAIQQFLEDFITRYGKILR